MSLKLEPQIRAGVDALSAPRCEIISRVYQAAAFLEEVRADLKKQVRQSAARDMAEGAFATALAHMIIGASALVPNELAQRPQAVMEG